MRGISAQLIGIKKIKFPPAVPSDTDQIRIFKNMNMMGKQSPITPKEMVIVCLTIIVLI